MFWKRLDNYENKQKIWDSLLNIQDNLALYKDLIQDQTDILSDTLFDTQQFSYQFFCFVFGICCQELFKHLIQCII